MTQQKIFPFSEAVTYSVYDIYNEDIGAIKNIYFDQSGKILYAILAVHKSVGNSKYLAVPWPKLYFNEASEMLTLQINKQEVLQSPALEKSDIEKPDHKVLTEISNYYGNPNFWQTDNDDSEENRPYEEIRGEKHQGYEGSVKATEDVPPEDTADEVNYDKIKGIEKNS